VKERSEKLFNNEKKSMFEKIIAIKNVNQSEAIVVLTLLFLTYVPTKIIIKYDNELIPKGKPITTSLINPAKNTCPLAIISGLLLPKIIKIFES
jgi:hypothetical protein